MLSTPRQRDCEARDTVKSNFAPVLVMVLLPMVLLPYGDTFVLTFGSNNRRANEGTLEDVTTLKR